MDRKELPRKKHFYAEEGELAAEGFTRRSDVTGRHDAGSGANETLDGLDASSEAIRRNAEDRAVGENEEDRPVFDRSDAVPKV